MHGACACSSAQLMLSDLSIMVATINKLTGLPSKFFIATRREAAFFQICPSCLQEQANEVKGHGYYVASDMIYCNGAHWLPATISHESH